MSRTRKGEAIADPEMHMLLLLEKTCSCIRKHGRPELWEAAARREQWVAAEIEAVKARRRVVGADKPVRG